MRLRWNSASSRAKTLADEPQHCEQNVDGGDLFLADGARSEEEEAVLQNLRQLLE